MTPGRLSKGYKLVQADARTLRLRTTPNSFSLRNRPVRQGPHATRVKLQKAWRHGIESKPCRRRALLRHRSNRRRCVLARTGVFGVPHGTVDHAGASPLGQHHDVHLRADSG